MRKVYSSVRIAQAFAAAGSLSSAGILSKWRIVSTMPAAHLSFALHVFFDSYRSCHLAMAVGQRGASKKLMRMRRFTCLKPMRTSMK